ncbi:MAG TPA: winged helix-turn-helix domain-containing protein [Bryobacteraceae bacterium]|nr:winged helix-turn-helix domain-containing protein [Bryobacteraceae bacterium]
MQFSVGAWRVRPELNSLIQDGREIHITPKAMDVLVYLAQRPGQVVPKEAILQDLWAGLSVTDDALTRCIGEIRRAVNDTARQPAFIETVAKRGYRILLPVTCDPANGSGAPASQKWRWIAPAAGFALLAILLVVRMVWYGRAGASEIQSLAVLPLANLTGDPGQDYFADGMTEELITMLAHHGCNVISRTSVMRYKGTRQPLQQIARDLNVGGVIEGSVMRSGGRVRITAQLIDVTTDLHRWSGTFEREINDVLTLQSEIALAVIAEIRPLLKPGEFARNKPPRRVVPEAYEDYLKGLHFFRLSRWNEAAGYFEQATQKDPGDALSFALLCEADRMVSFIADLPKSDRALNAMHRALELDNTLAEAVINIGDFKFYGQWDWAAGEAEFRRAIELDPRSLDAAHHYLGCQHVLARWETAFAECKRAMQLDPLSKRTNEALLGLLVNTHQWEVALQQFRKTTELYPDSLSAWRYAGYVHAYLGNDREAVAAHLRADQFAGRTPEQISALEQAAGVAGLRGYWRERLRQLERKAKQTRVPPLDFAMISVHLGDHDAAFRFLDAAYREHSPRLAWLKARAIWDPLRSDPRFQALVLKMGFPK